ncbi:MAG: hypothetical protein WCL30_00490, partial [Pseudomonadota bacterium]
MSDTAFNYDFVDKDDNVFSYSYDGVGKMELLLKGNINAHKTQVLQQCKALASDVLGMEVSENLGDKDYRLVIKTKPGAKQHDLILMIVRRFLEGEGVVAQDKKGNSLSREFEDALVSAKLIDKPIVFVGGEKSHISLAAEVGNDLLSSGVSGGCDIVDRIDKP